MQGLRLCVERGDFATATEIESLKGADVEGTIKLAKFPEDKMPPVNIRGNSMGSMGVSPISEVHVVRREVDLDVELCPIRWGRNNLVGSTEFYIDATANPRVLC